MSSFELFKLVLEYENKSNVNRGDDNWLKHSIYFSDTKQVSKRDVNFRPKQVQAFQPIVRTY